MATPPVVQLKSGREKSLLNRHPWVFSGGVQATRGAKDGELVLVAGSDGKILGSGFFNGRSGLRIRMLEFGQSSGLSAVEIIRKNLERALASRAQWRRSDTTAYRLVNGESDNLPGLIVDRYGDVVVVQVGALGFEQRLDELVSMLRELLSPRAILNRSHLPSRTEEGLEPRAGQLWGEPVSREVIQEYGHKLIVDFENGQKTGMFLDHRESRRLVGEISRGKKVLNCFSFSGGFSVQALAGGASQVTSVDSDAYATGLVQENMALNHLPLEHSLVETADVFDFLDEAKTQWDLIILDPPAFAKKAEQVNQAAKGYKRLMYRAMQLLSPGGLLLTCSCSAHVDEHLFGQLIFQASRDAGRHVQIVQKHRHAFDHGVSVYYPEGNYLKSFLLAVGS